MTADELLQAAEKAADLAHVPRIDRDDAIQDAAVAMLERGTLSPVVGALAAREGRRRFRSAEDYRTVLREPSAMERMAERRAPSPEAEEARFLRAEALEEALDSLEFGDRLVVTLFYGLAGEERKSVEQIAREMDISMSSVERRLRRARVRLADLLEPVCA